MLNRPELLTLREYISHCYQQDTLNDIRGAGSLQWRSNAEAAHLYYVRKAASEHRDINAENLLDYRRQVSALCWYSINGNVAAYDSVKRQLWPTPEAAARQRLQNFAQRAEQEDARNDRTSLNTANSASTVSL